MYDRGWERKSLGSGSVGEFFGVVLSDLYADGLWDLVFFDERHFSDCNLFTGFTLKKTSLVFNIVGIPLIFRIDTVDLCW